MSRIFISDAQSTCDLMKKYEKISKVEVTTGDGRSIPNNYDFYFIHYGDYSSDKLIELRRKNPKAFIFLRSGSFEYRETGVEIEILKIENLEDIVDGTGYIYPYNLLEALKC